MRWLVVASVLATLACTGEGVVEAALPPDTAGPAAEPAAVGPAFVLVRDQVRILPFSIRFQRLAAVVGRPTTDAIFDAVRANRIDLGDHDFANGIRPDPAWTAARISLWASALRPVCATDAVRRRFGSLPAGLDALVLAAYGRRAVPEDKSAIDEALVGLPMDEVQRHRAVCLAVLSSLEFVSL